jgi:hypothetical protein
MRVKPEMAAIFDLLNTWMSGSVHASFIELLDPENVGVSCGISLLACIEREV